MPVFNRTLTLKDTWAKAGALGLTVAHMFAVHRGTRSVPASEIGSQAVNNR